MEKRRAPNFLIPQLSKQLSATWLSQGHVANCMCPSERTRCFGAVLQPQSTYLFSWKKMFLFFKIIIWRTGYHHPLPYESRHGWTFSWALKGTKSVGRLVCLAGGTVGAESKPDSRGPMFHWSDVLEDSTLNRELPRAAWTGQQRMVESPSRRFPSKQAKCSFPRRWSLQILSPTTAVPFLEKTQWRGAAPLHPLASNPWVNCGPW